MLAVYLLDTNTEDTIRKAIRQTSGGSFLALDPSTSKAFVNQVQETVGDLSLTPQKPVLLTSMDVRRYIRKLIELDLPGAAGAVVPGTDAGDHDPAAGQDLDLELAARAA